MQIWVDADACPNVIKEILFRAAQRTETALILVANQALSKPPSSWITSVQVASGFDVADNHIVQHLSPGDLVITADIPLAAEVVDGGATAINPRGEHYSRENIRQRLAMRDMMEELRSSGEHLGGPAKFNQQDRQRFANTVDRILAKKG